MGELLGVGLGAGSHIYLKHTQVGQEVGSGRRFWGRVLGFTLRDAEGWLNSVGVVPYLLFPTPGQQAFEYKRQESEEKGHCDHPLCLGCLWQMDDPSVGPKIPQALEKIDLPLFSGATKAPRSSLNPEGN